MITRQIVIPSIFNKPVEYPERYRSGLTFYNVKHLTGYINFATIFSFTRYDLGRKFFFFKFFKCDKNEN